MAAARKRPSSRSMLNFRAVRSIICVASQESLGFSISYRVRFAEYTAYTGIIICYYFCSFTEDASSEIDRRPISSIDPIEFTALLLEVVGLDCSSLFGPAAGSNDLALLQLPDLIRAEVGPAFGFPPECDGLNGSDLPQGKPQT